MLVVIFAVALTLFVIFAVALTLLALVVLVTMYRKAR